jgi:hypothetical protein
VVTPILRNKLDKQSEAFNLEWTSQMGSILEEVRTTRPELDPDRICLVDVQYSGTNAYGAPESYLWHVIAMNVIDTNDQVHDARVRDCDDAENQPWKEHKPFYCRYAPAFHPNVAGANRYQDVIMNYIRSKGWLEEWRGGPWIPTYKGMTASMEPPRDTPEERLTQWTGKILARETQPPYYPVRGTVVISRGGVERKRVSTDTEFSWTFARTITVDKELCIQDDRVTVHAAHRLLPPERRQRVGDVVPHDVVGVGLQGRLDVVGVLRSEVAIDDVHTVGQPSSGRCSRLQVLDPA